MPALPRPRRRSRLTLLCLVAALAPGLVAAGCGDSADRDRLQAEEVARAKAEGRREARAEQAAADAKAEAAKLREELEDLRTRPPANGGSSGAAPSTGGDGGGRSSAGGGGSTSCGGGLSVNAATSCPFARSVRSAFERSGGSSIVEAYSPVTKQLYTMRCVDGVPTVCRGGNGAVVYIR